MKKGIKKEYYEKVGKRYIKKQYWDFPSIPADGLWIVNRNGLGRGLIAHLYDLEKINLKVLGMLAQYEDECAKVLMDLEHSESGWIPSASERIKGIFKVLAGKVK